jgi:predicted dehydrogenase
MTRIGFVGTGDFAREHVAALRSLGCGITACYSTNQQKAEAFAKDFGARVFDDPLAMISKEIIDALFIVVPPFAHDGSVELKAVEQHIPFLCEKPVGLNLEICRDIADEVKKTGLVTCGSYLLRQSSILSEIRELLHRNKISTIRSCRLGNMPQVHWWRRMDKSGGMMLEQVSHSIDLIRCLIGEVKSVSAVTASGLAAKKFENCDIYDSMEALMVFENSVIGSIGASHLLNHGARRYELLEVCGQDFYMSVSINQFRYKEGNADWVEKSAHPASLNLLQAQDRNFLDAVKDKRPEHVRSTYPDAVQTLAVALAMNESAQSGQSVAVPKI